MFARVYSLDRGPRVLFFHGAHRVVPTKPPTHLPAMVFDGSINFGLGGDCGGREVFGHMKKGGFASETDDEPYMKGKPAASFIPTSCLINMSSMYLMRFFWIGPSMFSCWPQKYWWASLHRVVYGTPKVPWSQKAHKADPQTAHEKHTQPPAQTPATTTNPDNVAYILFLPVSVMRSFGVVRIQDVPSWSPSTTSTSSTPASIAASITWTRHTHGTQQQECNKGVRVRHTDGTKKQTR